MGLGAYVPSKFQVRRYHGPATKSHVHMIQSDVHDYPISDETMWHIVSYMYRDDNHRRVTDNLQGDFTQ